MSFGVAVTRSQSETSATQNKSAILQNQRLAEELLKLIIRKLEKQKVHLDLADILLII